LRNPVLYPCETEGQLLFYTSYTQQKEERLTGLATSCVETAFCKGKLEGRIEIMGRQGRRCKQLVDDLKKKRRYWKLKEEALDCTLWRTRFGRGYGPVVRQTTE
jgi:hypothetical protein